MSARIEADGGAGIAPAERLALIDETIDNLFASADRSFLSSAISREEGVFLRRLASAPRVQTTIEIGCANGVSSLYICSGLLGKDGTSHTALDPFQSSDFHGRGVQNVRRAQLENFRLIEEPSELALPRLLADGARYDLAFIDGLHTADQTLLDFYYIDRLLRIGGVVVFDDVQGSSVNKVVRYAATYPNYRFVGAVGSRGTLRRVINVVKQCAAVALGPFRRVVPERLLREFLDISLVRPEVLWTIDWHTMVALQKTGEGVRDTNWYCGI